MDELKDMDNGLGAGAARGLSLARSAGLVLAVVLLAVGSVDLFGGLGGFELFKGGYFVVYGFVLALPFNRLSEPAWRWLYGLLVVLSVFFVFLMVAVVMFAYMAAADRGERLGIPGLEGTLIFFSLMQVPVVLFQRKPDLLD